MNKRLFILISVVLAVVTVVTGVLYAQEKGNISTLKMDLAAAETQILTLETQASTLVTKLADSKAEVSAMITNLTAAEAQTSTLETDLAATEAQISTLETDLVAAEAHVATLKAQVSILDAEVLELKTTLAEAGVQVTFPDVNLETAVREAIYYATTSSGQGRAIFENTCMRCHTIGSGIMAGPDLKDVTSRRNRDWLISFITSPSQLIAQEDPIAIQLVRNYGGRIMPNFGLSAEEAEAALVYIEMYVPQVDSLRPADKPKDPIYTFSLEAVTTLEASRRSISDLTGLEYCLNLKKIYLTDNLISDISTLANLTNLETLVLGDNNISDISTLAGLTSLEIFILDGNNINDISALAGLTNSKELWLRGNGISDISALAGLPNLQWLFLGNNNISDISPLVDNVGFSNGDSVNLMHNPLSEESINIYIPQLEERGVTVIY